MTVVLVTVLAVAIGVVLGMLGGGGSILTLPMLVYVAGVDPKAAIAMSLFVVGSTSVVGTALHARAGRVRWKVGSIFGASAMAGAYAGGAVAHLISATVLLVAFAVMMLLTSVAMLRARKPNTEASRVPAYGRVLALGLAVGLLSGLVGAGGGFLIVPALVLLGGLPMREAVGTSLFVIALQSFAGFAGHIRHVELDWTIANAATLASVVGTIVGTLLAAKVSTELLRRAFAWLVLVMGLFVLSKQLPPAGTITVSVAALVLLYSVTRGNRSARPAIASVQPPSSSSALP